MSARLVLVIGFTLVSLLALAMITHSATEYAKAMGAHQARIDRLLR
jgi:hypothetical protein